MSACCTDSSGSTFSATGTCICWRELHDWHCIMQYLNTCNILVSNENAVIWTGDRVSAEENCGIDIAQCSNLNTCNTGVKWKCSHLNRRQSPAHLSRQISDYWHFTHVISAAYCFKLHVHFFVKCFLQHTISICIYACCIETNVSYFVLYGLSK